MNSNQAIRTMKKQNGSGAVQFFMMPEIGILIPIVIIMAVTASINDSLLTWRYFSTILTGCIFIGMASLAESLIIMVGEIDLSIGMSGCLAGVICGITANNLGWPLIPCILATLLTGMLVGAVNGVMITKFGLSSWIATLATQFICQGLAVTISDGLTIPIESLGTKVFTRPKPLGLSWLFFVFVIVIIILDFVVRKTTFGYRLRAVGGNKEAAQMAGINVNRIKLLVFILAGALAAVSGLFDVLTSQSASSTYGSGREFRAIICCAIGGISMAGGAGSIYGVGLGVLLFHVLWNCLRLLKVDTNLQLVLIGAILVLAVLMDIQRKRMEAKRITQ
ncbi:MAG: ABC transporter permease [Eubacteriales bacterium]|nr:ABC transporter permease [Eubacteriales bacterium]